MKKLKKLIVIALAVILCIGCLSTMFTSKVCAATYYEPSEDIKATSTNPFEFSAYEFLNYVEECVESVARGEDEPIYRVTMDVTGKNVIPLYQYDGENRSNANYQSGRMTDVIASKMWVFQKGCGINENKSPEERTTYWETEENSVKRSVLAGTEGLTLDDIKVTVKVKTPRIVIDDLVIPEDSYEIKTDTKFTQDVLNKIASFEQIDKAIFAKINGREYGTQDTDVLIPQQVISITATTTGGDEYRVVIGSDYKWYLLKTETTEFKTELTYKAEVEGVNVGYTMDKGTCVPKYDTNNVKKDADVTAIIKSKNDLEILTVDGKEVGADKAHANEDGWYYTTAGNKKEIAKLYKFSDYDNLDDNGTVVYDKNDTENNHRGKVKVVLGSIEVDGEQLKSEENVSIQWPFRIIEDVQDPKEIKDDTTKVTRTITTNLPIDKEKLPDGWKFTETDLGKSQHQVYKEYTRSNGNVSETPEFKENGRTDTVKAEVKIDWEKEKTPEVIPQTGIFSAVIILAIVGFTTFGITRYRKINK